MSQEENSKTNSEEIGAKMGKELAERLNKVIDDLTEAGLPVFMVVCVPVESGAYFKCISQGADAHGDGMCVPGIFNDLEAVFQTLTEGGEMEAIPEGALLN